MLVGLVPARTHHTMGTTYVCLSGGGASYNGCTNSIHYNSASRYTHHNVATHSTSHHTNTNTPLHPHQKTIIHSLASRTVDVGGTTRGREPLPTISATHILQLGIPRAGAQRLLVLLLSLWLLLSLLLSPIRMLLEMHMVLLLLQSLSMLLLLSTLLLLSHCLLPPCNDRRGRHGRLQSLQLLLQSKVLRNQVGHQVVVFKGRLRGGGGSMSMKRYRRACIFVPVGDETSPLQECATQWARGKEYSRCPRHRIRRNLYGMQAGFLRYFLRIAAECSSWR